MTGARIPAIVVGTGFGCRIHVPALRDAGFEVVALVGTNPEKLASRAEKAGVARSFTDLDEAITATGAKLVTIATPPNTHAPLTLAVIGRGCHVLCEKPFASNAKEAQSMVDAAETAGVANMVAHEFRWQTERALFGRALAEGLVGEPRFLVIDQFIPFCADPDTKLPKWWFDVEAGGGWLGAGGSHLMDQIRAWLGDFDTLSANLMTVSDRDNVADDSYSLRFRLKNGVEGSMQQCAGAWGPYVSDWRCAGSKGTIWIDQGKVMLADKQGTREVPVPGELVLPMPAPGPDARIPASFELPLFTRLCEALHATIEGKPVSDAVRVPTFRDGLESMRILDAIRASARAGGALQQL